MKIRVTGFKAEVLQIGDHQELRAALPNSGEIIVGQSGETLLHNEAYYTLNHLQAF